MLKGHIEGKHDHRFGNRYNQISLSKNCTNWSDSHVELFFHLYIVAKLTSLYTGSGKTQEQHVK